MCSTKQPENQPNTIEGACENDAPYKWDDRDWIVPPYQHWQAGNSDYQADERRYWRHQVRALWANVAIGIVTLIAAITAAAIAYWAYEAANKSAIEAANQTQEAKRQVTAAEEALRLTKNNFIIDQRPYVWLTNNLGNPELWNKRTDGKVQIIWTYHYTNYGRTPANNILIETFIRLGNGPFEHMEGYKEPTHGAPLPPTKDDHGTIVSAALTPDEANQFVDMDGGIGIAGIFTYEDASGNRYETEFCIARLKTGDIAYQHPTEHCDNRMK